MAPPDKPQRGAWPPNRSPLILAAVGAWLASACWAILAALAAFAAIGGEISGFRALLPIVLVVLYALRGYGALRGDERSLTSLLWLHGVGAVATLLNARSLGGLALTLSAVKIVVNLFGAATAYYGRKALRPQ